MNFPVTVEYILSLPNCTLDESTVTTRLSAIDQDAIRTSKENKFSIEIWNEISDINGISASEMLTLINVPEGSKIFLIKDTDANIYNAFQYFNPNIEGIIAMTEEGAVSCGNIMKNDFIDSITVDTIVNTVLNG
jgi:hypothetical protein